MRLTAVERLPYNHHQLVKPALTPSAAGAALLLAAVVPAAARAAHRGPRRSAPAERGPERRTPTSDPTPEELRIP